MLAVALGLLIGLSLGAIGGGGSILTVPILVLVMGQSAHVATATSLAIVGGTALAGAIPHWRAGRVSLRLALPFGLAGILGTFGGAAVNHLLPDRLILALFGVLMLVVTARMVAGTRQRPRPVMGGSGRTAELTPVLVTGLGVGLLTGFFGVGGGFLIVPALVLGLGIRMRVAVGTSLVIIAINSASGLLAHLRYGSLDLTLAALFTLGGVLGALAGAALGGRVDDQRLQRAFAGLVAIVGAVMLIGNLPFVHLTR